MASYFRKGASYAVVYRLPGFPRQYIYGIKTEQLARRAKQHKDLEEQLAKAGLLRPDPHADHLKAAEQKSIVEHIKEFRKDILAGEACEQHADQQAAHCRRLFRIAKMTRVSQIACEPIQRALSKMLGPKCGPRTCNAARQAAIQFEKYLHEKKAVRHTCLSGLSRFNEQKDIRRKRRPLTQEEVEWLLTTTEAAQDTMSRRCGISPADRATLYATGLGTGFRRRALLSLQKQSFLLKGPGRPFVRLAAKFNKTGKDRDQLLPDDLAEQLQSWLLGKTDTGPLWRAAPHADLGLRFRRDMEAARKAWIATAPNEKERERRAQSNALKYVFHDGSRNVFADFHGLRHTAITFIVRRSGIRVGQEWADHSTPVLTARYAEVDHADLVGALAGLPSTKTKRRSHPTASAGRDT